MNNMRRYEHVEPPELENPFRFQPNRAMAAGLIAGAILILIPRGSPWEGMAFSEPVIMGRHFPGLPLSLVWPIHLSLSVVYGLFVCRVVAPYRIRRAIVIAGLAGLVLYVLNLAVAAAVWGVSPSDEIPVVFTHFVFALIAAGAYRGFLRRTVAA
jgi:hypothetical protein